MKKHLFIALVFALASTSVFATRARLESLQESKDGSYFIEDGRNIFLNAAHVNHIKNSVTLEWGDTQTYDTPKRSAAEGGFFKSHGNLTYGVYFGRQADSINLIRGINAEFGNNVPGASKLYMPNYNNLDLYLGGDMNGVEWGAAVSYSSSSYDQIGVIRDADQSALSIRLGMIMGATEAWVNASLMNEFDFFNGTYKEEFEGKIGLQVGMSHGFGPGYRAYAQFRKNGADHIYAGNKVDSDYTEFTVGLGKTTALNDNANLFAKIEYVNTKVEIGPGEAKASTLPVTLGVEADVKEWLTLRASVKQELFGQEKAGGFTNDSFQTTSVAGGASIKWADMSIDGSMSKYENDTVTRLGMTYNF